MKLAPLVACCSVAVFVGDVAFGKDCPCVTVGLILRKDLKATYETSACLMNANDDMSLAHLAHHFPHFSEV